MTPKQHDQEAADAQRLHREAMSRVHARARGGMADIAARAAQEDVAQRFYGHSQKSASDDGRAVGRYCSIFEVEPATVLRQIGAAARQGREAMDD